MDRPLTDMPTAADALGQGHAQQPGGIRLTRPEQSDAGDHHRRRRQEEGEAPTMSKMLLRRWRAGRAVIVGRSTLITSSRTPTQRRRAACADVMRSEAVRT